jgi:hypothetical protein
MGLKRGEKLEQLAVIEVVDVRREPLDAITDDDVAREGFPGKDAAWFVAMFRKAMGVGSLGIRDSKTPEVTRIEFRLVPEAS